MRIVRIVLTLLLLTPTLFEAQSICIGPTRPGCECDRPAGIRTCEPEAEAAPECPCWTVEMIQYNGAQCTGTLNPSCSTGDPYYLLLSCDPGGVDPPVTTGIYVTYISATNCTRTDTYAGNLAVDPITADEIQACIDAINGSGYCQ